jgi:hypothetical protein
LLVPPFAIHAAVLPRPVFSAIPLSGHRDLSLGMSRRNPALALCRAAAQRRRARLRPCSALAAQQLHSPCGAVISCPSTAPRSAARRGAARRDRACGGVERSVRSRGPGRQSVLRAARQQGTRHNASLANLPGESVRQKNGWRPGLRGNHVRRRRRRCHHQRQ